MEYFFRHPAGCWKLTVMTSRAFFLFYILSGLALLWAQDEPVPDSEAEQEPAPLTADPARDLFEAAELAYAEARTATKEEKKKVAYESAVRTFQRFLKAFPENPRASKARFYLAVSQEKLGHSEEALASYAALVLSNAEGAFAEAACQKVATTYYENQKFDQAETFFGKLAQLASKPETRHYALYQRALCLQKLDRPEELKDALRAVVFDDGSPFSDKARAAIASLYQKDGDTQRAYANYQILANNADKKLAAEATLQSALMARELGKETEAAQWFRRILSTTALEKWHGRARLTLMSDAFQKKDYASTLAFYEEGNEKLSEKQEAQRIAMAAESYRRTGREEQADTLYARLAEISPDQGQAFDAAYAVLTKQYREDNASFFQAGLKFLQKYEKERNDDPRVDNVHLMLAEKYYDSRQFENAAQQYNSINLLRIAPDNVSRLRYRLAFSRMKADRQQEARESFNVFLANHPDDKLAPRALAHRASLNLALKDREAALLDYQKLLSSTRTKTLRRQALTGLAQLYREDEDYPKLIEVHRKLLAEFPERSPRERAASNFVMGWALFKEDKLSEALPLLKKARELNPEGLGKDATLHLALIYFSRQEEEALQNELDRLLTEFPDSQLPRPVYAWLGAKRAAQGSYPEAWKYLNQAVTPERPDETKTAVWKAYSKTAEALGNHREALVATEILIPREESAYLKAVLIHRKAKALLGLRQFEKATAAAKKALELKPQGKLNGELRLTMGDIARVQGNIEEALSYYTVVAELMGDASSKDTALRRLIDAYEAKGDSTSLAQARRYREMLK
jgi:tetratricopeptide (TPR) repeat protein